MNLGVKFRIYGGFAIVVALTVTLAGFAVWQLGLTQTEVARMGTIADNNARVLQISQTFEVIQRTYLQYKAVADEAQLKQASDAEQKALSLLSAARQAETNDARLKIFTALENGIGELKTKRVALATLMSEVAANHQELNKVGETMSTVSNALVDRVLSTSDDLSLTELTNSLARSMLLIQVANWRFQATHDKAGGEAFKKNVDTAIETIDKFAKLRTLAIYRDGAESIKKPLAEYSRLFAEVSAAGVRSDALFSGAIVPKLNEMAAAVEKIEGDLRRDFNAAKGNTDGTIANVIWLQQLAGIIMLLLGIGVAYLMGRSIVNPIAALTGAMRELAGGNFDVLLPGLGRKDELGQMAKAVETFKVRAAEKAEQEAAARASEAQSLEAQRREVLHKLASDFEGAVGTVVGAVGTAAAELENAAHSLTNTAETTEQLVMVVADVSQSASSNVQMVAAASEEMATSVAEVGRQVQESNKIATEAVEQARQTDIRINELSQAASRIGDVVKLITAIAEQTNLLALNATIEAARAGDAGRGFAVVASEVKQLASQTAKATEEIGTQIASMQHATADSVAAIKAIGTTINRVSEIATVIAAAVEEQGVATQEIARNAQNAAKGTAQVTNNISDVRTGAQETGTASSQVLGSAKALSAEGGRLKAEVANFLQTVRAA
jgi:methyl-accepting chemotaxis protein